VRIFLKNGSKLVENIEEQFLLEREIQTITEQNLHEIFKLEFVASKMELAGFRIDTLNIKGETMTLEQMGLILKQFSNPEEIRHREKGTFEKERNDP
jgi:hypothetical protein